MFVRIPLKFCSAQVMPTAYLTVFFKEKTTTKCYPYAHEEEQNPPSTTNKDLPCICLPDFSRFAVTWPGQF